MDKYNTQMENWKKQIIMDPVLCSLFDHQLSAQDLLVSKILPLPQDQILIMYPKLAALKHLISKSLQKEVETKSEFISKSFNEAIQYRKKVNECGNIQNNQQIISHLKKFNAKYESVEESLSYWSNITKILNFSKGLESFRVNCNILRTLMRGYNGQQQAINPIKIAKIIKQLYYSSVHFDFTGMQYYQREKMFISSTKSIVHQIAKKNIIKSLMIQNFSHQNSSSKKQSINKWIQVLINLNTLREFVTTYFKTLLMQLAQKVKQSLKDVITTDINANLEQKLIPFIIEVCFGLLLLEETLIKYRKTESFQQIPNLLIRFWEKMSEYFGETISWLRKQHKNIKRKGDSIIWKYPILYKHCSSLCDIIHSKLLTYTIYNCYSFASLREKFIVSIAELGCDYHRHCKQLLSIPDKQMDAQTYVKVIEKLLTSCPSQIISESLAEYICSALNEYGSFGNQAVIRDIKKKTIELFKKEGIKQNISLRVQHLSYFYIQ